MTEEAISKVIGPESKLTLNEKISKVFLMTSYALRAKLEFDGEKLIIAADQTSFVKSQSSQDVGALAEETTIEAACIALAYGAIFIHKMAPQLYKKYEADALKEFWNYLPMNIKVRAKIASEQDGQFIANRLKMYYQELGQILDEEREEDESPTMPIQTLYNLYVWPLRKTIPENPYFNEKIMELLRLYGTFMISLNSYRHIVEKLVPLAISIHGQRQKDSDRRVQ